MEANPKSRMTRELRKAIDEFIYENIDHNLFNNNAIVLELSIEMAGNHTTRYWKRGLLTPRWSDRVVCMSKDISNQMNKTTKAVLYFFVVAFAGSVARYAVNYVFPKNSVPEYDSSVLSRTVGGERFSVRLSKEASLNTETLAAINSRLSANGVSVSGNLYQDSPFKGYVNIQAGCIKYSFAGDNATYLASSDSVKDSLDGMKGENTSKGFSVEETARNYSQNGDVYGGVLDTVATKEGTKIFTRQKVSVKGNYKCMLAVVAYDTNMLNHVYDDVNNSFVYKW